MNDKYGTWRCLSDGSRAYWRTVLPPEEVKDLDAHL